MDFGCTLPLSSVLVCCSLPGGRHSHGSTALLRACMLRGPPYACSPRVLAYTAGGLLGQRGAPYRLQYRRAVRRCGVQPPLGRWCGVLHHAA